ncbi:hypothetical protein VNO80_29609 [Phaseolus coccineus]|uniref:Uncharacterized protein n=1 Tax=Phaseolus coccineus TaxID=3886 RepID=A0AAN9QIN4_PHACN
MTIHPTDFVIVRARPEVLKEEDSDNKDSVGAVEVSILENRGKDMYRHHGFQISAFPLCTTWLYCPFQGGEREDLPKFALRDDRVVEVVGDAAGVHKEGIELIASHLRKVLEMEIVSHSKCKFFYRVMLFRTAGASIEECSWGYCYRTKTRGVLGKMTVEIVLGEMTVELLLKSKQLSDLGLSLQYMLEAIAPFMVQTMPTKLESATNASTISM